MPFLRLDFDRISIVFCRHPHMIELARRMLAIIDDFITTSLARAGTSEARRNSSSLCLRVDFLERAFIANRRFLHVLDVSGAALAHVTVEQRVGGFAAPDGNELVCEIDGIL